MYNLSLHIEYLLLRHDCVVLPGLGAFINVRHAAWFDSERGLWHPMTREVRFNRALSHDDGLLTNSYARKNEVTFQEGRELLRRDIDLMTDALNQDGEVTVGHLGILRREGETLCFIPQHSAAQLSEMIGFSNAPVIRAVKQENIDDRLCDSETKETEKAAEETEPEHQARIFDTRRNYYIAVNKVFAKAAACVALMAMIAISIVLPVSDCNRADQASVVPVEKIIRATARQIAEPENKVEAKPVTPDSVQAKSESEQSLRFHAIVATFNTPEEAEKYVEQNAGCGYDLSVLNTRTRSRVSAMGSNDRETLQKTIMSPEFQQKFAESWIWEGTGN